MYFMLGNFRGPKQQKCVFLALKNAKKHRFKAPKNFNKGLYLFRGLTRPKGAYLGTGKFQRDSLCLHQPVQADRETW